MFVLFTSRLNEFLELTRNEVHQQTERTEPTFHCMFVWGFININVNLNYLSIDFALYLGIIRFWT